MQYQLTESRGDFVDKLRSLWFLELQGLTAVIDPFSRLFVMFLTVTRILNRLRLFVGFIFFVYVLHVILILFWHLSKMHM